jgi:hypothetical protein
MAAEGSRHTSSLIITHPRLRRPRLPRKRPAPRNSIIAAAGRGRPPDTRGKFRGRHRAVPSDAVDQRAQRAGSDKMEA